MPAQGKFITQNCVCVYIYALCIHGKLFVHDFSVIIKLFVTMYFVTCYNDINVISYLSLSDILE